MRKYRIAMALFVAVVVGCLAILRVNFVAAQREVRPASYLLSIESLPSQEGLELVSSGEHNFQDLSHPINAETVDIDYVPVSIHGLAVFAPPDYEMSQYVYGFEDVSQAVERADAMVRDAFEDVSLQAEFLDDQVEVEGLTEVQNFRVTVPGEDYHIYWLVGVEGKHLVLLGVGGFFDNSPETQFYEIVALLEETISSR